MMRTFPLAFLLSITAVAGAQTTPTDKPDLKTQPTLYVVGYAHLDTEWRWEYPQVIDEYIPNTMHRISIFSRSIRTTFSISAARTGIAS